MTSDPRNDGRHFQLGKGGLRRQLPHYADHREPRLAAGAGPRVDCSPSRRSHATMPICSDTALPISSVCAQAFLQGGEVPGWRDSAHWEFDFRSVAAGAAEKRFSLPSQRCNLAVIRTERFKYVHFNALPALLFDLGKDPGDLNDVADHPDYRSTRLELAERLLAWRGEHLDQSLALAALSPQGLEGKAAALPLPA